MNTEEIELTKRTFFDCSLPAYLLDDNFDFLNWNKAFEVIFARPLQLELKTSVLKFVDEFENREQVIARSLDVFSVNQSPASDHEPIIIKHQKYGLIKMQKLAKKILHKSGQEVWIVFHNICEAEKIESLFDDILKS